VSAVLKGVIKHLVANVLLNKSAASEEISFGKPEGNLGLFRA